MNKLKAISILLCLTPYLSSAQDILILTDGTELNVKVTEIDGSDISFIKQGSASTNVSRINSSKVFVILYKDGRRESFKEQEVYFKKPLQGQPVSLSISAPEHRLEKGSFLISLVTYKGERSLKPTGYTVNARVDVFCAGKLFTSLVVSSFQRADKIFDFKNPNAKYWRNNWITINTESEVIRRILFEKYENVLGKGFGWAIPLNFFSIQSSICSVAFLSQNPGNKEIIGFGGISNAKYNLMDCGSPEQRLLSVVMLWLDLNFGKSQG